MKHIVLPLTLLVVFTAVSLWMVAGESPIGFLTLARDEPWGAQVFMDLVMALTLFVTWMRRDARERGIPAWPYFIGTLLVGSPGALAYLVHRGLKARARAHSSQTGPAGSFA